MYEEYVCSDHQNSVKNCFENKRELNYFMYLYCVHIWRLICFFLNFCLKKLKTEHGRNRRVENDQK